MVRHQLCINEILQKKFGKHILGRLTEDEDWPLKDTLATEAAVSTFVSSNITSLSGTVDTKITSLSGAVNANITSSELKKLNLRGI